MTDNGNLVVIHAMHCVTVVRRLDRDAAGAVTRAVRPGRPTVTTPRRSALFGRAGRRVPSAPSGP